MPGKQHRLFFALDPDDATRDALENYQLSWLGEGRRVPGPNLHVTLVFLGNQPTERIDELRAVAGGIRFPSCRVCFDRPGFFKRPGVAWVGMKEIPAELARFREDLADGLRSIGFGIEDRPWIPHVTLYRKMRKPSGKLPDINIEWPVCSFKLLESVPVERGVKYQNLGAWGGVKS